MIAGNTEFSCEEQVAKTKPQCKGTRLIVAQDWRPEISCLEGDALSPLRHGRLAEPRLSSPQSRRLAAQLNYEVKRRSFNDHDQAVLFVIFHQIPSRSLQK